MDQNPSFRKIIVPWYDSDTVCYVLIACMAGVMLFGFIGMSVARQTPALYAYMWVPALLVVLSAGVILSTLVRLLRRYFHRYGK